MSATAKGPLPSYQLTELADNSFIYAIPDALPGFLCDDMVQRFEAAQDEQHPGRIGQQGQTQASVKKTTDLIVSGKPQWQDVDNNLHRSLGLAMRALRERFPFFQGPFKDTGYGIQRYRPGEYYHWHIDGGSHDFANRQMVALWYLNDVQGPGGETEFKTQAIKVQPERGKLLLFPPFWTHEHRACELQRGVKYIATSWIQFA